MSIKKLIKAWKGKNKRYYDRVEYPPDQRPILKVEEHEMEILNISVTGLYFIHDLEWSVEIDQWIDGEIVFSDGKSIEIAGQVVWIEDNEAGLHLSGGVAFPIIEEQISFHKTESP
ncbi:PilZ domain-containing protein [Thermodesulfobacteriota bacterium]